MMGERERDREPINKMMIYKVAFARMVAVRSST